MVKRPRPYNGKNGKNAYKEKDKHCSTKHYTDRKRKIEQHEPHCKTWGELMCFKWIIRSGSHVLSTQLVVLKHIMTHD